MKKKAYEARPKKLKRNVEFALLPSAIGEAGMLVPTGSLVAFKTGGGRAAAEIHVGHVWLIEGTHVTLWDETRERPFGFDLCREEKPVVKTIVAAQVTFG